MPMKLKDILVADSFSILAELRPPKSADPSGFIALAKGLKDAVSGFMIPDQRDGRLGISSLGAAYLLKSQGLLAVMQLSMRDRNRLALQGDLLAAHALGLGSVCVHRGQEISLGDQPGAIKVHDFGPVQALKAIKRLNSGRDFMKNPIEGATGFYAGTTFRLWTAGRLSGLENEVDRLKSAGAQFFVTPPVFDPESLVSIKEKLADREILILPTVVVLKSVEMAQNLRIYAKQVHMPDGLVSRLKRAGESREECLAIGREIISGIKDAGFPGVLVSALGWEEHIPRLTAELTSRS
jgi:methylenetetrahydrofolate reductase (NADPH)